MNAAATSASIARALELLGMASQDWRNGTADVSGALRARVAGCNGCLKFMRRRCAMCLNSLAEHGEAPPPGLAHV